MSQLHRSGEGLRLSCLALAWLLGCGGAAQQPADDGTGGSALESGSAEADTEPAHEEEAAADRDAEVWRVSDMLDSVEFAGGSAAGRQFVWVLSKLEEDAGMIGEEALRGRFSEAFIEALPPAMLELTFAQLRPAFRGLRVIEVRESSDRAALTAVAQLPDGSHLRVQLGTEAGEGRRIELLLFQPAPDLDREAPTTWEAWDALAAEIAPRRTLLFAEVTHGDCRPIRAYDADSALPVGSTFKLWVLAAVHEAVHRGNLAWETEIEVVDALRSLPSGRTQDEPPGARLSVRELAQRMIEISDNTATDLLIDAVGRERVEAVMESIGASALTRNLPFLMTTEMFALKADDAEDLRAAWAEADVEGRRALLEPGLRVESVAALGAWSAPRAIETIEWFASANDLCNVWLHLADAVEQDEDETAFEVTSSNPGVRLDPGQWPFVAYKGGSEPGVLSLSWLLQNAHGRTFVYVVGFANPDAPLDEALAVTTAAWGAALLEEALTSDEVEAP